MVTVMKIAVAGAGIGGLTVAALLGQDGHDVAVFDQFDSPRPIGSGLVIQPVGQAVLAEIDALDEALKLDNSVYHMLGFEAEAGRPVLNVRYDNDGGPRFGLAFHRASLFTAIWNAVQRQGIALHQSAAVQSAKDGILTLQDGTEHGPFDLIIDAAGATSPLSPLKSRPLPYGAIWGTVDWPETALPITQLSQCYRRADRMIGALPIGKMPNDAAQKAAIFWSLPRDKYDDWLASGLEKWKTEAVGLWSEFAPFAAQITDPSQMTMVRYSHGTLRKPYGTGLVHIGDAAHRDSPQLGQGANMALLDALALAKALRAAKGQDALMLYAKSRRLHVGIYQAMSAIFTPQYQSDSRVLPILRDRFLFPASQIQPIPKLLTAIVCGSMVNPMRGV